MNERQQQRLARIASLEAELAFAEEAHLRAEARAERYREALEQIEAAGTTYSQGLYPDQQLPPEARRPPRLIEQLSQEAALARQALADALELIGKHEWRQVPEGPDS